MSDHEAARCIDDERARQCASRSYNPSRRAAYQRLQFRRRYEGCLCDGCQRGEVCTDPRCECYCHEPKVIRVLIAE